MDQAFVDFIRQHRSFVLSGHEHPDGDCLGAQAALHHLLVAQGKQSTILNPDPVPRQHDFLLKDTPYGSYDPAVELPDFDAVILLDCAQLTRLGSLGRRLSGIEVPIAVIDHHVGSADGDGDVCLVDVTAPSTGALVYEMWQHFGGEMPMAAARGVFLSIVADTGWFRYSNTDTRALGIAAALVGMGVEASVMFDAMFRRNHATSPDFLARTLAGHELRLDHRFGVVCLDKAAMSEAANIDFDTDMLLEPLRSIDGIEVVALFKERYDGAVKLSLRSSRDVDVNAIARELGGGGHVKAAGALLRGPMVDAVAVVEDKVRAALTGGEPAR